MVKRKVSMTIDENVFNDFKSFCEQNGMKMSTKVELMMKDSVKDTTLKKYLKA
ncbi:MAG: hypothetical protein V1735_04845 [Nanoarchaeota archaeon]